LPENEWLKMNSMIKILLIIGLIPVQLLSFSQDRDAELTVQRTNITVINSKLTKDLHYEIKINNRAGEKYTKITIPYSKLSKVSNIDAYISDSNNRIVKKLKKSEIIERSSISDFSFYEDDFVKEFTLKHNVYPYTIVYSYQVQQNEFLYIDYWTPVISETIPTLSAGLTISVPLNYSIAYKNQNVEDPIIDTLDNVISYQWQTSYSDIIKPEVYSPPISDFLPSVKIIPQDFNYQNKGSFSDWISYGNWQYELLQGLNELPDNEKSRILALINDVKDDREKIKILYHYLQDETRYINITIETGGLKPYPANHVAQTKYGDCKALTNYFKSILDYIQIPSYYTKVNAGSPVKEIDKNFPSQQFNHVILYIPQKDDDIWLDCTSDGAFNYLGTFTQNRDAFVINNNNSHFIKTPSLKPGEVCDTRKIDIKYNPGDAIVKFQNTYKGDSYENILYLDKNYNEADRSRIVRNYIVADGFQLIDYHISKPDRDSVTIELSYEASTRNIYKHYGNDILINNIAFSLPDFGKPAIRKLPVQIDYPIYKIDTLIYQIPAGYKANKDTDTYSAVSKYGAFKYNIYVNVDNIMIIKSLLINSGYYPLSEYKEFYSFYNQIVEIENKTNISLYK
jgi:hypothetical protein